MNGASAFADAMSATQGASSTTYKLTSSIYQGSDSNDALDLNLRANHGEHAVWIGMYRDNAAFQQLRGGYEFTQELGPAHIVWSAQVASGGFLGGSVNLQAGTPMYGIVGFGRTNLRDYFNLNFDPNDAITLGLGAHLSEKTDASITHIFDDRLGTRQRVTHLYLHRALSASTRFSVDAAYKTGMDADGDLIRGHALTLTYAFGNVFIRLARDQYANFSAATQNRLSLGVTF